MTVSVETSWALAGANLRTAPIKNVAESLKLPVHERGSFEGWEGLWDHALHPVNLIIAVSFGLLIPREVLRSAAYGGLNLHPSLLPEYARDP